MKAGVFRELPLFSLGCARYVVGSERSTPIEVRSSVRRLGDGE